MKKKFVFSAFKSFVVFLLIAALVIAFSACKNNVETGGGSSAGSSMGSQAGSSEPQTGGSDSAGADVAGGVSVRRDLFGAQIKLTAEPIKVQNGIAALTIDYELIGSAGDAYSSIGVMLYQSLARSALDLGPTKINLVDLPNRLFYFQLKEAGQSAVNDASAFKMIDGATYARNSIDDKNPKTASVSLFEAPDADKVAVFIGNFGLIEDVPVVEADNAEEIAVAAPKGYDTDIKGNYTAPLRTVQIAYSDQIVTKEENKTVTIAVGSDVLFDTDKYDLSPTAQSALDNAIAQVKASAPQGEIQVVGHTDDVGETGYNQTLSEKRAQTVAQALTDALGADYKITPSGVGETQPAVEGTSSDARAANRRVEIIFNGQLMSQTQETQSAPAGVIPETTAPTASGAGQWVEYQTLNGLIGADLAKSQDPAKFDTYSISVDKIVRTQGCLVATLNLKVAKLGSDSKYVYMLRMLDSNQGGKDLQKRGYSAIGQMTGAYEVALLTGEGRVYPLDYEVPPARLDALTAGASMLSDTNIFNPYGGKVEGLGKEAHITIVWPDTGQDTVAIELPGAFRITDIPVSGN